ncbi:probable mitochondrial glutathione transporter SLC25A40 isoform X1 [Melospiza melodia melodia]|uniref:probable mitochondrial glutathione transporter SLC25A40 isoform X1 n=2 Tax=Melospiza melodia melodia TaxID=1914991 RepID=UPI002FD0334C
MAEMSGIHVQKLTIVQQAIASCCGAIITSLFVTPLDVIKTRLQAQRNPFHDGKCLVNSSGHMDHVYVCKNEDSKAWYKKPGHFKGTLDAFVKIIRIEGIKSLWSGLPPTLIMAIPTTAIYFTCYDQLCEALKSRPGKHDDAHIPVIAGSLSRFGSATVVSPLELIKTQMQCRRSSYKQLYLRVSTKVTVDGWLSLWQGWASTILRDVPFSAMYWYNYERFKKMMCKEVGAHEPTFFVSFTSGAASGSIAAVVTQPFDVVKTHRQTQLWENEALKIPQRDSKSTWAVMRKIAARNGITGLFAGKFFLISKKIQTREFLIVDFKVRKFYISISVNTVSYAIVCIYKATDM